MTTTIARNATRKISAIKTKNLQCKVYTLDNYFIGEQCDPDCAWRALANGRRTKLYYDDSAKHYTVHVHSNCWYRLTETDPK